MTISEAQNAIIEEFEELTDWEERYSRIIKMGRELSEMPDEVRIDKNKIDGCQSQVWMNANFENGKIHFQADSDAMIVKGFIALVIKVYSGQAPAEILS